MLIHFKMIKKVNDIVLKHRGFLWVIKYDIMAVIQIDGGYYDTD